MTQSKRAAETPMTDAVMFKLRLGNGTHFDFVRTKQELIGDLESLAHDLELALARRDALLREAATYLAHNELADDVNLVARIESELKG